MIGGGVWCVDFGGRFTKAAAGDAGGAVVVPIDGGRPDRPHLLPSATGPVERPRDDLGAGPTPDGACLVNGPEGPVLRAAPEVCAVPLRRAHDALRAAHGDAPDRFVLTHPGRWRPGSPRLDALRRAARLAGLPPADLVPEPLAMLPVSAARGLYLVVDLGATGEIAVVRRDGPGRDEVLAAWSDGYAGGDALDATLHRLVVARLRRTDPDVAAGYARADEPPLVDPRWDPYRQRLASAVTAARERLSVADEAGVPVTWPGGERIVTVGRDEFTAAAGSLTGRTIRACRALLTHTGVAVGDVCAVVVGGGAAGTPALFGALLELGPRVAEPQGDLQLAVVLGGAARPVGPAAGSARPAQGRAVVWQPAGACPLPAAARGLVRPVTGRVVTLTDAGAVWCDFTDRPVVVRSGGAGAGGLLALSPDRRVVVTGPARGRLRPWNGHGDRLAPILCGPAEDEVVALAVAADASVLVVRVSGVLERWRVGVRRWRVRAERGARVAVWPGGEALLGGPDGLRQIDADGTVVRRLDPRPVTALASAPDGAVVVYGDEVVLMDAGAGTPRVRWSRQTGHLVAWPAADPAGARIAVAAGPTVHLWNSRGGAEGVFTLPEPVNGLALAGDDLFAGQAATLARYRRVP